MSRVSAYLALAAVLFVTLPNACLSSELPASFNNGADAGGNGLQLRGRRLLLDSSATGTLQLTAASGLCATGGYTACLKTATYAVYGKIIAFNLTGPGCSVQQGALNISADGNTASGSGQGLSITLTPMSTYLLFSSSYIGGSVVCTVNFTVLNGTLLGVKASTSSSTTQAQSNGNSKCFPGSGLVQTPTGVKSMRSLRLGDEVLVAGPHQKPHFEEVFMFSHQDAKALSQFTTIKTASGRTVQVTPSHYVWAKPYKAPAAKLVRAGDLQLGDVIYTSSQDSLLSSQIVSLKSELARGLYNPHTASGSIIVDGIATSTFTDLLPASVAVHTAVTLPARILYKALYFQAVREGVNSLLMAVYFAAPSQLSWVS